MKMLPLILVLLGSFADARNLEEPEVIQTQKDSKDKKSYTKYRADLKARSSTTTEGFHTWSSVQVLKDGEFKTVAFPSYREMTGFAEPDAGKLRGRGGDRVIGWDKQGRLILSIWRSPFHTFTGDDPLAHHVYVEVGEDQMTVVKVEQERGYWVRGDWIKESPENPKPNFKELTTEIPKVIIHGDFPATIIEREIFSRLKPYPQKAQTMRVPEGTLNLAKGKKVSSNAEVIPVGGLTRLTDGNKARQAGAYTELHRNGPLYIQVDLEQVATIHGVWLWRKWGEKRDAVIFKDTVVQLSEDPDFKKGVVTLFNSDFDESLGLGRGRGALYFETQYGRLFECTHIKGRYVRIYSGGVIPERIGNSFVEIEVFGEPLKKKAPTP